MRTASFVVIAAILALTTDAAAVPITYVCNYKNYSDEKGLHKVDKPFVLTFLFDASTKKAYSIGNNGGSEVRPFVQEDGFTLVEATDVGNVMVTAITNDGHSLRSITTLKG